MVGPAERLEILKRCDGKATVAAIVEDLAVTFSADRDQVAADVRAFLQDLADKGMVALGAPDGGRA